MKIKDYIQSGILEEYCLGLLGAGEQADVLKMCSLFPEIQQELAAIESVMEVMPIRRAITPSAEVKEKILNSLGFPNAAIKFQPGNLPLIDSYSNHRSWLDAVQHLLPAQRLEGHILKIDLQQSEAANHFLLILGNDTPATMYPTEAESFFILKGECKCIMGDKFFLLGPGDFMEVPPGETHQIKLITPYVAAILQHLPA